MSLKATDTSQWAKTDQTWKRETSQSSYVYDAVVVSETAKFTKYHPQFPALTNTEPALIRMPREHTNNC